MKIATFNINNINKRLNNLIDWLDRAKPDVACLQELRAEQAAFPDSELRALGFTHRALLAVGALAGAQFL